MASGKIYCQSIHQSAKDVIICFNTNQLHVDLSESERKSDQDKFIYLHRNSGHMLGNENKLRKAMFLLKAVRLQFYACTYSDKMATY